MGAACTQWTSGHLHFPIGQTCLKSNIGENVEMEREVAILEKLISSERRIQRVSPQSSE